MRAADILDDRAQATEAAVSRRRQQAAREQVIEPLRRAEKHNQFAEIIRASLIEGRGRGT